MNHKITQFSKKGLAHLIQLSVVTSVFKVLHEFWFMGYYFLGLNYCRNNLLSNFINKLNKNNYEYRKFI